MCITLLACLRPCGVLLSTQIHVHCCGERAKEAFLQRNLLHPPKSGVVHADHMQASLLPCLHVYFLSQMLVPPVSTRTHRKSAASFTEDDKRLAHARNRQAGACTLCPRQNMWIPIRYFLQGSGDCHVLLWDGGWDLAALLAMQCRIQDTPCLLLGRGKVSLQWSRFFSIPFSRSSSFCVVRIYCCCLRYLDRHSLSPPHQLSNFADRAGYLPCCVGCRTAWVYSCRRAGTRNASVPANLGFVLFR